MTYAQETEYTCWQRIVRHWPDDINKTTSPLLPAVRQWGEALVSLRMEHAFKQQVFLVMVDGYWGRGTTIKSAAERCLESGGKRTDKALVKLVIGDNAPSITEGGMLSRKPGSEVVAIGYWFKLGQLLNLEET